MTNRMFRHLFEKATADSTNLWITTKSETDRLPRRAGFGVILHVTEWCLSLASSELSELTPSGGMSRMTGKEGGGPEDSVVVTVDRCFFFG